MCTCQIYKCPPGGNFLSSKTTRVLTFQAYYQHALGISGDACISNRISYLLPLISYILRISFRMADAPPPAHIYFVERSPNWTKTSTGDARPSVHPFVRASVRSTVRPSVRPPDRPSVCPTVRTPVRLFSKLFIIIK